MADEPRSARVACPAILYIGSYGRSGSTLLGRMLAESPGTICVGETRYLWSRGLLEDAECGCGAPVSRCSFWSAVAEEAFGGWHRIDVRRMANLDQALNRLRTLPAHLLVRFAPHLRARVEDYAAHLAALYRAISLVSGANTVVEISKDPTFACVLARIPDAPVSVVHLTRDPRAVAYSWTRVRREPSPIAGREFMPRFSPIETASKWVGFDVGLRAMSLSGLPQIHLTYEELIADPGATLRRIGDFAKHPGVMDVEITGGRVTLGAHHMFSANPMRTRTGSIPLCIDDEWRARLSTRAFLTTTALTLPRLRAYGYPVRRRRPASVLDAEPRDELARA